jgi:hypothetical protein
LTGRENAVGGLWVGWARGRSHVNGQKFGLSQRGAPERVVEAARVCLCPVCVCECVLLNVAVCCKQLELLCVTPPVCGCSPVCQV